MRPLREEDAAVIGAGAVTPLGFGAGAVADALAAGRRAAPPAALVEPPFLRAAVPEALEAQAKFLNGSGQMAATAAAEAASQAGLSGAARSDATTAFYLAQMDWRVTDYSAYRDAVRDATDGFAVPVEERLEALNAATVRRMNPFYLLETLNNNASSLLTAWHGLRGANASTSGGAGAGLAVVGLAARAVARGDAAVAMACGAARLSGPVTRVEASLTEVAPAGDALGEGAGALVMEGLGAARRRGARALAAVAGHGAAFGPAAEALPAAARAALAEAGARPGDIAAVVVPDRTGAAHLAALPALAGVPAPCWRSATGHAGPASDAVDAAVAAVAVGRGAVPGAPDRVGAVLLLARGIDGAAYALVLAPA